MSDLVQPDPGELVEDVDAPRPAVVACSSRRGPRLDLVVLLRKQTQTNVGHQAVAVLQVQTRVSLPEDEPTSEQRSMRGPSALGGAVAFYAEHWVVQVQRLDAHVDMGQDLSAHFLRGRLRRCRHSRAALSLLEASLHRNVAFVAIADAMSSRLLDGSWSLLSSVPLSSSRCPQLNQLPLRAPTPHEFRAASARRATVHGLAFRPRKKRRVEPTVTDLRRQVLWTRAARFHRNSKLLEAGASAVLDAIFGQYDVGGQMLAQQAVPSQRSLSRNVLRLDAVGALLQRREGRDPSGSTIRGIRADSSPKLGTEIFALQLETMPQGTADSLACDNLPGASLVHGCCGVGQKCFLLLWGLFLVCGPTLLQMRQALQSIRFVVSDQGTEAHLADCFDCLDVFWRWASGGGAAAVEEGGQPAVRTDAFLLPRCTYVPGWHHLWANIVKSCSSELPTWPETLTKLRTLTAFLRIDAYRLHWGQWLRGCGRGDLAAEVDKPFHMSFVQWRWETLPGVVAQVSRFSEVFSSYFHIGIWGAVKEPQVLRDVSQVAGDKAFWALVCTLAGPMTLLEHTRLWGAACPCHGPGEQEGCPFKSRRLHEASARVEQLLVDLGRHRDQLTLENCGGCQQAQHSVMHFIALAMSSVRTRFQWLDSLPYAFSRVSDPRVAARVLQAFEQTPPASRHRVAVLLMGQHGDDVRAVAAGHPPSAGLLAEELAMRQVALSEAPIEGYHAEVAKLCRRAPAAKAPFVFGNLRLAANLDRVKRWADKPGGETVIAFEWARYKRVVRVGGEHRGREPKMTAKEFAMRFYKLHSEAVGDLAGLADRWFPALGHSLPERPVVLALKHEWCRAVLRPGEYYTLAGHGPQRDIVVFSLVRWYSGREKIVGNAAGQDRRHEAAVQVFSVWRGDVGEYPPARVTVFAQGEPRDCQPWQLSGTWSDFRQGLLCWRMSVSDTAGCLDLHGAERPEAVLGAVTDESPVICMLELLRERGWRPSADALVEHSRDGREYDPRKVHLRRSYVQVLLRWGDVGMRLAGLMRSDQPDAYYKCLLQGKEVEGGRPASYYAQALQERPQDLLPLVDGACDLVQGGPAAPQQQLVPECLVEMVQDDLEAAQGPPRESQGRASAPAAAARGGVVLGRHSSEGSEPSGESSGSSTRSSSTNSSSSSRSSVVNEAAAQGLGQVAGALGDAAVAAPHEWPREVEGQPCYLEHGPGYQRLALKCRWHEGCSRRRNIGEDQQRLLGHMEPVAFLAVWHRAGEHMSREEHRRAAPSVQEQRQWLASRS